jgi:eukaryotic-like serine/threonine-protein kinase
MSDVGSESMEFNPREPIPGYRTTELIGRGGSGEVWRAVAPGGLAKAVKIVYGDADDERTRLELKALARIKDVRHPLLLSIERIEIAGTNLVIVTELADCSLKEHFIEKRKTGSTGVPQDELWRYLNDAAEALDFLYGHYSLQHLDVKPENILLLSGRAKVGDFGLVKNLYERSHSIVGGLTPTFSPPEVFDGNPTRYSDQYSLGIVYMQMLTGVLPFNGGNAAQLATQHLRGVPDLSALPRRQRPVIARALSKDPAQRFENSVAMMVALKASFSDSAPAATPASVAQPSPANACGSPVRFSSRQAQSPFTATRTAPPGEQTEAASASNQLDGSQAHEEQSGVGTTAAPLIIVGIGGSAVQVLGKLVDLLHDRIGDEHQWPPIQIILLDSDARALTARSDSEGPYLQLLPIRLRSAESFGSRSAEVLKWLNRRWFYGIPRDLTTSSYRPLGRLALITHAARVREAIETAVSTAGARLASAASSEGHAGAPRVIVLGSICGGTGGGAILDVAYAVRGELKRQGLSDDDVHGVLLHATPRGNAERDKSIANAYAFLSELHHYSRPGSNFPGEASLATPPFHGDNATFRRTHILDLGRSLGGPDWELAVEKVAEFLYVSQFTPARETLDGWQNVEDHAGKEGTSLSLWCCDMLAFGAGTMRQVSEFAQRTCVDVVRLWRQGLQTGPEAEGTAGPTALMTVFAARPSSQSAKVEATVRQKLIECNLVVEHFLQEATEVVKLEAGCDAKEYVARLVDEALAMHSEEWKQETDRVDAIVGAIDEIFRCNASDDRTEGSSGSLFERIVARLAVRGRGRATTLLEWIREMVDTPAVRVEGARQYAAAAKLLLREIHERLVMKATENRQCALALAFEARGFSQLLADRSRKGAWPIRKNGPLERLREVLNNYAGIRLREALFLAINKQLRLMEAEIGTLIYQLDSLSRSLGLFKERLMETNAPAVADEEESHSPADSATLRYQQLIVSQLASCRDEIARTVEQEIDQRLVRDGRGLRRFLEPDAELYKTLSDPLTAASRRAVLECLKAIVCRLMQGAASTSDGDGNELLDVILQGLTSNAPSPESGAAGRILVVPADVDAAALRDRMGPALENVAIIGGRTFDVSLCTIRKDVPLGQFASEVIGGLDVFRELAGRLHTRIDVQWTPIGTQTAYTPQPSVCESEPLPVTPTSIIAVPKSTTIAVGATVIKTALRDQ